MNRARVKIGLVLLLVVISAACFLVIPKKAFATTGTNQELSFEGKVVNASGLNIPDATYNMEFKIYSGGTPTGGGTLVWTEDYLVGGAGAGIAFTSGTYQTNLGSVCSLSGGSCETYTNTGVNWNTYPLYLSMQIGNTSACTVTTNFNANCGGDGEMSPYILLTSTPYAFNSAQLGGLAASAFGQLATNQTWTGTNTFATTSAGALAVQNAGGTSALNVDTSNSIISANGIGTVGVVSASLPPIVPTTATFVGTAGTTSYSYEIVAIDANGATTLASPAKTTAVTANVALSPSNTVTLGYTAVAGATNYLIYRTATGGTAATGNGATVGQIGSSATTSFIDTGYLASSPAPANAGTLANTTYFFKVTAVDANGGQTTASTEVSKATGAANLAIALSWSPVAGARSYRVYYGTTTNTEANYVATYTNSYNFTAPSPSGSTVGTPPAINSAYFNQLASSGSSQITLGSIAGSNSSAQLDVAGSVPTQNVGSVAIAAGGKNVSVAGSYAYIITGTSLQIAEISNQSNPKILSTTAITSPVAVFVQGRYAYVASSIGVLYIYDVHNNSAPILTGSISENGSTLSSLYVAGRYAYMVASNNLFIITDVSNPANPTELGTVATGAGSASIFVKDHYAYVANSTAGTVQAIDMTNTASPVITGSVSTGVGSSSIYVSGNYAYVIGTGALKVVDISNPVSLTIVGSVATGGTATSIFVQGNYAYVTSSGSSLTYFDISNPSAPLSLSSVAAVSTPTSVFVIGRYAYVVSSGTSLLQIFDLGGAYVQQLQAGGTETDTLQVDANATIRGDASVNGGFTVTGATQIAGDLGIAGATYLGGSLTIAGAIQGGITDNSLAVPAAPTITFTGTTGTSATWSYVIVAVSSNGGVTPASTVGSIAGGDNTTLSAGNYNVINWSPVPGAVSYKVYRTTVGTSPNTTGLIATTGATILNDTGLVGDASTAPIVDTSGISTISSIQSSGSTALTLTGNAASTWSTTVGAITIQSGTGNIVLQANGTGTGNIDIGTGNGGGGSGTPDLLVLDDKSSAGDPAGVAGAMYYNTSTSSFRCYEAVQWQNCLNGLIGGSVAGVAVNNCTVACSAISTGTSFIPANYCVAGRVINVVANGIYSTVGTPTLALSLYLGTNAAKASDTLLGAAANQATAGTTVTNLGWTLNLTLYCVSTTSVWVEGSTQILTSAAGAGVTSEISATTPTTITNTTQNLYIFPAWGTANAANTITTEQFIVTGS